MDKNKYIKWYNLARDLIKDDFLVPKRTNEEIFNLVSEGDWLLFCPKDVTKEDSKVAPEPNVYFYLVGTNNAVLGLSFNNLPSYDKFKTIMSRYNIEQKDKITKKLLVLDSSWVIRISRKIKEYNFAQTPRYVLEKKWVVNKLNEKIIDELISIGDAIREEGKEKSEEKKPKFYLETPTIDLLEAEFSLNEKEFGKRIVEVFDILRLCLDIKTNTEINKERKKSLREKEAILKQEREALKFLEVRKNLYPNKSNENEFKEKQKTIAKLESEIKDLDTQ